MRHAGLSLEAACAAALSDVTRHGGQAGLIAVSASGEVAAPFTSAAMTRGWRVGEGPVHTAVGPDGGG
jgi:isoaspartyl peptidase/L-asparaginase-like protein (Ntn-hydrolase superfamily)